jgi:hypothetical protein
LINTGNAAAFPVSSYGQRTGGAADMLTVDVLIPVYRPGKELEELLDRLVP